MNEINVENILKLVKTMRTSEGIPQSDMAKRIGVSTSFYGMIERGNRTLSVEMLCKIANAFDCSAADFLELVERQDY